MAQRKWKSPCSALGVGFAMVALLGCGSSAAGPSGIPAPQANEYRDQSGRFTFSYPSSFGTTSPGTNDGFGNRVASIRFSMFSTDGIGGEAALTRGAPVLDLQAAGSLYDAIGVEALSTSARAAVDAQLPLLTPATLCAQIGAERHLDTSAPAFGSFSPAIRSAIDALDSLGNSAPRVLTCVVAGDTVSFDKEAAVVAGGPRRRVYGAVRFGPAPYSTFQLIRSGGPPSASVLADMRTVVESLRLLQ
jgi:hypothetical protein